MSLGHGAIGRTTFPFVSVSSYIYASYADGIFSFSHWRLAFSLPCNPGTRGVGRALESVWDFRQSVVVSFPTRYFQECRTRISRSAFLSGRYQAVGALSHLPGSGDTGPTIYRSQRDKSLHVSPSRIHGPNLVGVGQKVSMVELNFHHGLISLLALATNLSRHATVSKCRGCGLLISLL